MAEGTLFWIMIKRFLDVRSADLVKDYHLVCRKGTTSIRPTPTALRHLFARMRLSGYRIGVLSALEQTWFVKQAARGSDDIYVSPATSFGLVSYSVICN